MPKICTVAHATEVTGEPLVVSLGDRFADDHPLVVGNPDYFKDDAPASATPKSVVGRIKDAVAPAEEPAESVKAAGAGDGEADDAPAEKPAESVKRGPGRPRKNAA